MIAKAFGQEDYGQKLLERERRLLQRASAILLKRLKRGRCLSSPEEVKTYLRTQIGHLEHEVFSCLFLDNQHAIIAVEEMFRGTIAPACIPAKSSSVRWS